jgi:hypothetical protein
MKLDAQEASNRITKMFEVLGCVDCSINAARRRQTPPKFFDAQQLLGAQKERTLFGPERQKALLGVLRNGSVPSLRSHSIKSCLCQTVPATPAKQPPRKYQRLSHLIG